MPDFDDVERWGDDVAFGGCCLPASPAAFSCGACGVEWGHLSGSDERPDQGAGLRSSQPGHSEDP